MVFSSAAFLFLFFPIVLVAYFASPRRIRNIIVLVASLIFYSWGEPVYVVLMICSIAFNWLVGIGISKCLSQDGKRRARFVLVMGLVANLLILGFFKYESFLAANINLLVGSQLIPDLELPLPIGISFFTLQAVSYIVDVYWGKVKRQKSLLNLGMYIAMFPQLIAGPIVRYETIEDQVENRRETLEGFASGLRLFVIGLGKKVLIADNLALLANSMLASSPSDIGAIGTWGGLLAYSFQLFFDFSGYSDMAIGLGRMFGFQYLRNFNYPYISKSVTEFWRRWHMSLSSFFRDYIYIPLGGSRCGVPRQIFNLGVVWAVTGLWHGAAWNFVLWGVYYGVLLVVEKFVIGDFLQKLPAFLQHLYTVFVFVLGWCLFWISDPNHLAQYFAALFGANGLLGTSTFWELSIWAYLPLFVIAVVASMPVVPWLRVHLECALQGERFVGESAPSRGNEAAPVASFAISSDAPALRQGIALVVAALGDLLLLGVFALCVMSIVSGAYSPFIYFQF
ncbi:MAG: hypothetical protein PEGG_02189 [Paraeggerthella hongkongensis]|uniref:MBOAT family O-acyltransferase n=1 Tax=Paraeggerthella sp. Marseille-Q4926 TaxID=2866587 RepID=UPI001CE4A5BE|nr:MBOAT family protein [Paraeggerthella sp. Marseille-Q4926]